MEPITAEKDKIVPTPENTDSLNEWGNCETLQSTEEWKEGRMQPGGSGPCL